MMEEFDFLRLTAHLKIKSTSPILFQIHFQNQFSWVKLLEAVRRERLYGRCNYLNRRGKGTGQWRFCRAKFKIILRLETEKRFWHGDVALKITAQLVTLLRKTEVWSWYWYGISRSSCSNHRKYSERNIKLERDYELFRGGDPDILLAEAVDFFGKSWVWSAFILMILFYTSVFIVC